MDLKPTEPGCDEGSELDEFSKMLHALQTCASGDREYQLFFKPSDERLKLLHRVLLCTDLDGSIERHLSKASNQQELTECILDVLKWLNPRKGNKFTAFMEGAATASDQKCLWTLLLETAVFVEKKRSSSFRKEGKSCKLIFEQPVTSSPLHGLPPGPLAKVEPEEDDENLSYLKKVLASDRSHPTSSGEASAFSSFGEEMAVSLPEDLSLEQLSTAVSLPEDLSLEQLSTVNAAGDRQADLSESAFGDAPSKVLSSGQVAGKELCEEVLEATRAFCSTAESLAEGVDNRLTSDTPQTPMIDFDGTAVEKLYNAACHFEVLAAITKDDT